MAEIFTFLNVAQNHLASGANHHDASVTAEDKIDVGAVRLVIYDPLAAANPLPKTPAVERVDLVGRKGAEQRNLG
jgi:hypothetical protein